MPSSAWERSGPTGSPHPSGTEFDGLALAVFLVGLVPLLGFAVTGRWSAGELGVGAVLALLAGGHLASAAVARALGTLGRRRR